MTTKSKKIPSDFDFCPTHHVFFKSCKCKRKADKEKSDVEEIREKENE